MHMMYNLCIDNVHVTLHIHIATVEDVHTGKRHID